MLDNRIVSNFSSSNATVHYKTKPTNCTTSVHCTKLSTFVLIAPATTKHARSMVTPRHQVSSLPAFSLNVPCQQMLLSRCHLPRILWYILFHFLFFCWKINEKKWKSTLYSYSKRHVFFFVWSLDHLVAYILILTLKMLRFINLNSSFLA